MQKKIIFPFFFLFNKKPYMNEKQQKRKFKKKIDL